MADLILNKTEAAILRSAARRGDDDPGFQELLLTLNRLLDPESGRIFISQNTLEMIQRYGGTGATRMTWQATLHAIFARTLGETLGRKRDNTGRLVSRHGDAAGE